MEKPRRLWLLRCENWGMRTYMIGDSSFKVKTLFSISSGCEAKIRSFIASVTHVALIGPIAEIAAAPRRRKHPHSSSSRPRHRSVRKARSSRHRFAADGSAMAPIVRMFEWRAREIPVAPRHRRRIRRAYHQIGTGRESPAGRSSVERLPPLRGGWCIRKDPLHQYSSPAQIVCMAGPSI